MTNFEPVVKEKSARVSEKNHQTLQQHNFFIIHPINKPIMDYLSPYQNTYPGYIWFRIRKKEKMPILQLPKI